MKSENEGQGGPGKDTNWGQFQGIQGKAGGEGQEDQGTLKQLGGVPPIALLRLLGLSSPCACLPLDPLELPQTSLRKPLLVFVPFGRIVPVFVALGRSSSLD